MKNYLKISFITVLSILACFQSKNCNAQVAAAKQVLSEIYKTYDSIMYLSFDVTYNYDTDTLYGDYTHDQLKGVYTMNGKSAYYRLGDIEFMQNDRFLISSYNKDKILLVSDPQVKNAGGYLPMRAQMDSMFAIATLNYNVTMSSYLSGTPAHTIGSIIFSPLDSSSSFKKFTITYDSTKYQLLSLQYIFSGRPDNPNAYENLSDSLRNSILNVPRTKILRINFSNYGAERVDNEIYQTNSYVFFEDKKCKPVSKYKEYKVYYSAKQP